MTEGYAMQPYGNTARQPLRREIDDIGAAMAQRLRENMAEGMTTAEGEFALGDSDVCISIDPTGADVEIYSERGLRRSLPNIEQALRRALPDYGDTEDVLRAEREEAEAERLHYRNLCRMNGWPACW